ncbi:hypothetical protein T09_14386 [Trichinella sp. T9]|nr:hypothetical protein T09_14386 [Trichinella sp. T9]
MAETENANFARKNAPHRIDHTLKVCYCKAAKSSALDSPTCVTITDNENSIESRHSLFTNE